MGHPPIQENPITSGLQLKGSNTEIPDSIEEVLNEIDQAHFFNKPPESRLLHRKRRTDPNSWPMEHYLSIYEERERERGNEIEFVTPSRMLYMFLSS